MREKLHLYLLDRPAGASPRELLDLVFTQPGADAEFGPRFVRTLLADDARFAWSAESGRWIATAHAALARPLSEASFVVVDLETAGGQPAGGTGIIEIGAVRVDGGRIGARFAQLVNPGRRLPPFITQLTGISDDMLADQPPIEQVMGRFLAFAGDAVLVAHNARFDLSFLNAALQALDGRTLHQPHLCTLRLARRLLPTLRRRGLDSVAGHFGIPLIDRHRALGDALMTAEILVHFLELLAARGVTRLAHVLDFQYGASDGRRFECALPAARVQQLPAAPGIYRFSGEDGRLLYIGKSKNLRQRVSSYLSNAAGHRPKTLDLIRHIRDVAVEETGSELEAALLEAEQIRRWQPPYNRLRKHLPRIAFLKLSLADPFPRLAITARVSGGRARHIGPFRSRAAAQEVADLLSRLFHLRTCAGRLQPHPDFSPCVQGQVGACSMPCCSAVVEAAYREQVGAALSLFDGEMDAARATVEQRREAHAAALRFEAAARAQRDLELIERLRRMGRTLGWVIDRQHFVVMQPARAQTAVHVYVAAHGRLAERYQVRQADELEPIATRLAVQIADPKAPRLAPEEVDATVILAAWLRDRGERDGYVFPVTSAAAVAGQLPEWAAALAALLPPGAHPRAREAEHRVPAPAHPEHHG